MPTGSTFEARLATIHAVYRGQVAELLTEEIAAGNESAVFSGALRAGIGTCGIAVEEVCRAFSVDKASVSRWKNGTSAPHQHIRREVLQWVVARLTKTASPKPKTAEPGTRERPPPKPEPRGLILPGYVFRWFPDPEETPAGDVFLDDSGEAVLITLPTEATALWLAGHHYPLVAVANRPLTYTVVGLSHENARAFAKLNEQRPWVYTFAWDPWDMAGKDRQYVRAT